MAATLQKIRSAVLHHTAAQRGPSNSRQQRLCILGHTQVRDPVENRQWHPMLAHRLGGRIV